MVEWLRVGENALYDINPLNKYIFFLNFQLAEPTLPLGRVGSLPRAEGVSKHQKKWEAIKPGIRNNGTAE